MFPDDVVEIHLEDAEIHLYSDDWNPRGSGKAERGFSQNGNLHLPTLYGHVQADVRKNGRERDETRDGPIDSSDGWEEEAGDI